jgi:hypothetical protein
MAACMPTLMLGVLVVAYVGASIVRDQSIEAGSYLLFFIALVLMQALCMYTSETMAYGALGIVGIFFVLNFLSILGTFGPSAGPQPCGSCNGKPKNPCGPVCPRCNSCRRKCRCR